MKHIYMTLGFICLTLGMAGMLLPILPAAPFLLVSAFCFSKGSERLYKWLQSTNLYKNHVECFVSERAMPLKAKISILFFASTMLLGAFFAMDSIYSRTLILLLIVVKYHYFISCVKTKKK